MLHVLPQVFWKPRLSRISELEDLLEILSEDLAKFARVILQLNVAQVSVKGVFFSLGYIMNDLKMRLFEDAVDAIFALRANSASAFSETVL